MFITVVHKDNMNQPIAWLNVFENATTNKKIEGDRILEFTTIEDNLKTPYLYDKGNYKVIADGQIYSPIEVTSISETGQAPKVKVEAEHESYSLNDNTFELYEHTGNVITLMNAALVDTGFIFDQTDIPISETKELKIPFTNSRYLINRIAREFKAKIMYDNNKISLFRSFSNATGIRLTIEKNLQSIQRIVSHKEGAESITYEIDVNESRLESLEKIDLGDALIIIDKVKDNTPLDRVVIEVTKDLLTDKVTDLVLGDPNPKFSDLILDLILDPVLEEVEKKIGDGVITEVIHQQVINVETAHILNAWIKNLFVGYVETNIEALIPGGFNSERHYIRVIDEEMEFISSTLSSTETEPLLIADPNGSGGKINVFYTAIGSNKDAYRYFTITNPKLVHKDLTDKEVDAFKVYVRKTLKEEVKMKIEFSNLTTESGVQTVMPMMTWGQGTDTTGNSDNGKGFILKDDKGLVLKYVTQAGKTHQIRLGEDGIEGAGVGGNFKSLDHYSDGFVVNGSSKFKWVAGGLQKEDGTIIPIKESGGNMP